MTNLLRKIEEKKEIKSGCDRGGHSRHVPGCSTGSLDPGTRKLRQFAIGLLPSGPGPVLATKAALLPSGSAHYHLRSNGGSFTGIRGSWRGVTCRPRSSASHIDDFELLAQRGRQAPRLAQGDQTMGGYKVFFGMNRTDRNLNLACAERYCFSAGTHCFPGGRGNMSSGGLEMKRSGVIDHRGFEV